MMVIAKDMIFKKFRKIRWLIVDYPASFKNNE